MHTICLACLGSTVTDLDTDSITDVGYNIYEKLRIRSRQGHGKNYKYNYILF